METPVLSPLSPVAVGTVSLIGAGPGDPGLLTMRGAELLRRADVVVYDRLAHPFLLTLARPDAERIYVGKASAHHSVKQADINDIIIEKAKLGKNVARLKGGDPFVFGRGGEEAEYCRERGVPFEIVPGVTSAIAAPAYAGIPVTHRDAASSFCVVTGHERDDKRESGTRDAGEAEQRRDWSKLAHAADTLVFLMGVEALPDIAAKLVENGRDANTPVALVQWGTWSRQRVVVGTLETIVEKVREAKLTPPAVCVVGEVVNLRESLRWFDDPVTRPLFGKRIVITRAREQASAFGEMLRARGAEPIEFPAIRIVPTEDTVPLDDALKQLSTYRWLVFTSANAVPIFAQRMAALGLDSRALAGVKIATIGPATAAAVFDYFRINADYTPEEAVAEAVIEGWPDRNLAGAKILLPRALEARDILPESFTSMGASVTVIPVYETVPDLTRADALREEIANGEIDAVTFASSSTVRNFMSALTNGVETSAKELLSNVTLASIGPITSDTIREFGLEPQISSAEHTMPGLVSALESFYREQ